jgi:hypothetical protein
MPATSSSASSEFGRGKTIGVLALVVGCFAVLWPKLFHPIFVGRSNQEPRAAMDPSKSPTPFARDFLEFLFSYDLLS